MPTTNTYDAANELSTSNAFSVGITTYTSDAAGNLLTSRSPSNQRTTNTWDFENRLTKVVLPSAIVDTFTYNGDGQRVQKIDSTGTTKHVWDGQNILLETDGSNIIQVVYTLQPLVYGGLISQRRTGTTSFFLFDGLGSTAQLASNTGSVTDNYTYDTFGNALITGSSANSFCYIGRFGYYIDGDIAQYWARARHLDPRSGRFISRAPLVDVSADLYGYRLVRPLITSNANEFYVYVENNPGNHVDPSGLPDASLSLINDHSALMGISPISGSPWKKTSVPCTPADDAACNADCTSAGSGGGKNTTCYIISRTWTFFWGIHKIFVAHRGGNCLCCPNAPPNKTQANCPNTCPPPNVRIDLVPPSATHFPCTGNHWHYQNYNQAPPPNCTCFPSSWQLGGCL